MNGKIAEALLAAKQAAGVASKTSANVSLLASTVKDERKARIAHDEAVRKMLYDLNGKIDTALDHLGLTNKDTKDAINNLSAQFKTIAAEDLATKPTGFAGVAWYAIRKFFAAKWVSQALFVLLILALVAASHFLYPWFHPMKQAANAAERSSK